MIMLQFFATLTTVVLLFLPTAVCTCEHDALTFFSETGEELPHDPLHHDDDCPTLKADGKLKADAQDIERPAVLDYAVAELPRLLRGAVDVPPTNLGSSADHPLYLSVCALLL